MLLATVTPLALDTALAVQAELENRAAEANTLRRQRVERAAAPPTPPVTCHRLAPPPAIPQSRPDKQPQPTRFA